MKHMQQKMVFTFDGPELLDSFINQFWMSGHYQQIKEAMEVEVASALEVTYHQDTSGLDHFTITRTSDLI